MQKGKIVKAFLPMAAGLALTQATTVINYGNLLDTI